MRDDAPLKENHEERLLYYIDIPYFRNNPTYIESWRRYYEHRRDPQILLLMYYKEISTHYHWIYIELAKHFVRLNKVEIAHFILSEALQNKVYDQKRLADTISRLPPFERKYSKGDMACVLNQRNIRAIGKVWNRYEEVFFYERYLDASSVNFEMMKMNEYLKARGSNESQPLQFFDGTRVVEHGDDQVFIRTIYFSKEKHLEASSEDDPKVPAGKNDHSAADLECSVDSLSLNRDEVIENHSNEKKRVDTHKAPAGENEINADNGRKGITDHKKDGSISLRIEDKVPACCNVGRDVETDKNVHHDDLSLSRQEQARHPNDSVSIGINNLIDENIKIDSLINGEYGCSHNGVSKDTSSGRVERTEDKIAFKSSLTAVSNGDTDFVVKKCRTPASTEGAYHDSLEAQTSPELYNIEAGSENRVALQNAFKSCTEIHEIHGELENNSELIINDFVHLVQESGDGFCLTMRIARDADITQTLAGRNFCLKEITRENAIILNGVRKSEYCVNRDNIFVIFEFDKLESLPKILTFCDSTTSLFYLKQVLDIINEFAKKDIILCNLDFFVDQNFNVVLFDHSFEYCSEVDDGKTVEKLRFLFSGCNLDFNQSLAVIGGEIDLKTNSREFHLALLRHKAAVLNAL